MADHSIRVYKDSDNELRVHPAVLVVKPNDDVDLVNHTDEDLVWITPPPIFSANTVAEPVAKKAKTAKKKAQAPTNGAIVNYIVYATTSGKKAKGNSDPVIIIDN